MSIVCPDLKLSSRGLARLIEKVGKACHNLGYTPGLNPAQWAALRYSKETTADRRTVTGFANFQGTTKGTASQTVTALVRKGHLEKVADKNDRRVHRLMLTQTGEELLIKDPLQALADAIDKLEEQDRRALSVNMEKVLRDLLRA